MKHRQFSLSKPGSKFLHYTKVTIFHCTAICARAYLCTWNDFFSGSTNHSDSINSNLQANKKENYLFFLIEINNLNLLVTRLNLLYPEYPKINSSISTIKYIYTCLRLKRPKKMHLRSKFIKSVQHKKKKKNNQYRNRYTYILNRKNWTPLYTRRAAVIHDQSI